MFTGIIETTAMVIDQSNEALTLERPSSYTDLKLGSSISVSGACLSVTSLDQHSMRFQVVPETLLKTKIGSLKKGDVVNLERAMRADGRFDGHVVQGHVEGVGTVVSFSNGDFALRIPSDLLPFIIHKGSITLDGVSLTVARIEGDLCTVALIPLTLSETTLGNLKEGDSVNVETDLIGRYVQKLLLQHS